MIQHWHCALAALAAWGLAHHRAFRLAAIVAFIVFIIGMVIGSIRSSFKSS